MEDNPWTRRPGPHIKNDFGTVNSGGVTSNLSCCDVAVPLVLRHLGRKEQTEERGAQGKGRNRVDLKQELRSPMDPVWVPGTGSFRFSCSRTQGTFSRAC